MLIAALGDVNGQANALKSVLDFVMNEGILTVIQTGNLAGESAGDAVIALLEGCEARVAQGEIDRLHLRFEQKRETLKKKLSPDEFEVLSNAHAHLSSASLEYLRSLHKRVEFQVDGIHVLLCHGSPTSQADILDKDTPLTRMQRQRESVEARLIVSGGATEPFSRQIEDTLFVGPGPLLGPRGQAQFTLIDTDAHPWRAVVQGVTIR